MTDDKTPRGDMLAEMVNRFLGWKLPEDFSPDCGISFKRRFNEHTAHPMKNEPIGTNLLDAIQTKAMLEHVAGPALTELQGALDSINEILIKHQGLLHDARRENAALRTQLEEARAEQPEKQSYREDDGCPTEGAVLRGEWRTLKAQLAAKSAEAEELRTSLQAALQRAEGAEKRRDVANYRAECAVAEMQRSMSWDIDMRLRIRAALRIHDCDPLEAKIISVGAERDALQARVERLEGALEEIRSIVSGPVAGAGQSSTLEVLERLSNAALAKFHSSQPQATSGAE